MIQLVHPKHNHTIHQMINISERSKKEAIVIYTKRNCKYCRLARVLFTKEGIVFQDIDITEQPGQQKWLIEQTKQTTVPYIFIHDKCIGGYSDLLAIHQNQGLSALLSASTGEK